jgi:hypothetical protein
MLLLFIFFAGCRGCDILDELDNGNADPRVLIVETWGTDIRNALSSSSASSTGGFGFDCLGTANFTARIQFEVRTGSIDQTTGQVVIDPNPYWEDSLLDLQFTNNTGFNQGTRLNVSVPATGAYQLRYMIEINRCSLCCHGILSKQCGNDVNPQGQCRAGFPRVVYEEVFISATRPPHNLNYILFWDDFIVRQCTCGCFTNC